ncbi:hypothetical protein SeMB42_g04435 [Synchytrium endobioticum]|nr:hypothetical protein SeMB42_g04435 [Synchytrium endobioticum]
MTARVTLYYSSVSGNSAMKKQHTRIQDILYARKIEFVEVDVAADEKAKDYMKAKSGKATLPQIFVDGNYKAGHDEIEASNEDNAVQQLLGL